ncbi:MAG: hypothetical protein JSU70_03825 [Phycisphaerales bacterium]|nr:MAG: hypothetical protein JSU70_03825 [Phycisphaerales bacterium]
MKEDTVNSEQVSTISRDVLREILRKGAQQMLAMAIESEVGQYIADHEDLRDGDDYRLLLASTCLDQCMLFKAIL